MSLYKKSSKDLIGYAGRMSEKKLNKELGGRARPASGAMLGAKGDIALPDLLMEAKSTTTESMGLKLDWLIKIAAEARREGRMPVLSVTFTKLSGEAVRDGSWMMVPRHVWEELFHDR